MACQEYKEKLSFGVCPICGGKLESGRISLHSNKNEKFEGKRFVRWYKDETIEIHHSKSRLKTLLTVPEADKMCYVTLLEDFPIPAGYCPDCGKIFAQYDINDEDHLLGTMVNTNESNGGE